MKQLEGGRHNTGSSMRTKGLAQHPETARFETVKSTTVSKLETIEDSAAKTDVAGQLDPMEKVLVLLVGFD